MKLNSSLAFLFSILIISGSLSAFCPSATRQIHLAAVTGETSGGVFQLTVETRPGNGSIFTAVTPRTGYATQESEETAVDYAFSSTGASRSECDVLFTISGIDSETTVDGPSAGAAMAVATRAALLGKRIREDVVMTGTISAEGRVGEVGGIIEKSVAASDIGAKYFLAPKMQVYETLLASSIQKSKDFRVIEVSNVSEAERILYSNYSETFAPNYLPESKPIPKNLEKLPVDADVGRFTLVANRVVDQLDSKVAKVFSNVKKTDETTALQEYFKQEIAKERTLILMGYPFTAANAAFLLSIDAEYVKIGGKQIDVEGSRQDVADCVQALSKPAKTRQNFHWAVGADLRRDWAEQKLNDTADSQADGYSNLRDLLFANSWCSISEELGSQAGNIGGDAVDETLLSDLANEKLAEAEQAITTADRPDYDALWHLQAGMRANESGDFGAAIYDATYASTMQRVSGENVGNVTEAVDRLMNGRQSLWGKIYYSQGAYIYADAKDGKFSPTDAYRILRYSQEIDKVSAEIDKELAGKKSGTQTPAKIAPGADDKDDKLVAALLSACVLLVGGIAIVRIVKK